MLRITQNNIYLISSDGRITQFSTDDFSDKLKNALSGIIDLRESTIVGDITTAVELTLSANHSDEDSEPVQVPASMVDDLTVRLLQNAGLAAAAEGYRQHGYAENASLRIPTDRMRAFLQENMDWTGYSDEGFERIAEKVQTTMASIGASDSSPELAIELARHFRLTAAGKVDFNLQMPKFANDADTVISPEEICANLSKPTRNLVARRILKIYPVNLKIISALRIDVRLTGIATENKFEPPLLEMLLEPAFIEVAKAVDEICLAADALFRARGNDSPANLLLNVADGYSFATNWMGCLTPDAREKSAVKLCKMLAREFARHPLRITCN